VRLRRSFDAIVEFSGLAEFIDTPIKRYSSGMYARLGFAVASHVNPDVLLVDEILSVGDFVFQRKCIEHMKQVIKGGATVLFVSHNLKTVSEFCQRCLLLERGRSLMIGPAEQVVSSYLERSRMCLEGNISKRQVSISKVKVRNQFEECSRFQSGEKAWIDVELRAHTRCVKLSLSLYITDDQFREVFNTSPNGWGTGISRWKQVSLRVHIRVVLEHDEWYFSSIDPDYRTILRWSMTAGRPPQPFMSILNRMCRWRALLP